MLTFALAVFFLLITPGPAVLTVAGVGSAFGAGPGSNYIGGLFIGTNLVAIAVVSGIAAIVLADEKIRLILLTLSATYLLFLAYKIAFAGKKIAFSAVQKSPGFWAGILLQIVNPKAYAVSTTLFTGFAFWPENLMTETTIKFIIINAIWIPVHFAWLFAGITLNRLNLTPQTHRRINIAMATSLMIVFALAILAPK